MTEIDLRAERVTDLTDTSQRIKNKIAENALSKEILINFGVDNQLNVLENTNIGTIRTPTETINITENGLVDVINYANAQVDISTIVDVQTATEMDNLLNIENLNKMYRYVGTTTTNYTQGNIYQVIYDGGLEYREYIENKPSYIRFSSPNSFTLLTYNTDKNWDGTLEYCLTKPNSETIWTEWDGLTTISSGSDNTIYLRGKNNTYLNGTDISTRRFAFTGTNISIDGNIEVLLDFPTVLRGEHPPMANYCFRSLFANESAVIKAPKLLATSLAPYCYKSMFYGCSNLVETPEFIAETLAVRCYESMFQNCTNLRIMHTLPVRNVANYCYSLMFFGTALSELGQIDANTTDSTLDRTFKSCNQLIEVTLTENISYLNRTFEDCSNLEKVTLLKTDNTVTIVANSLPFNNGKLKVYVPSSLLNQYKVAPIWSAYASQIYVIE